MGIRYLAIPLSPLDIEEAKACPRWFLIRDPFPHGRGCDRGLPRGRDRPEHLPDYLDLDKCWVELSNLFAIPQFQGNAGRALVEGNVRFNSKGWIPHHGVLDPIQVGDVAAGLSRFTESDIQANIKQINCHGGDDPQKTVVYLLHCLHAATSFTRDLAQAGFGLLYTIG